MSRAFLKHQNLIQKVIWYLKNLLKNIMKIAQYTHTHTHKRQQSTLLTTKFEESAGVHHKNSFFKLQSEVAKYTFGEILRYLPKMFL